MWPFAAALARDRLAAILVIVFAQRAEDVAALLGR